MPSSYGRKTVASQNPLATFVGMKVLEEGGNAFDAAVAVSAVLSVVMPHTSGLGGDGLLMARTREGIVVYNGSGWSGKRQPQEVYRDGPLSITVPGLVDLWDFLDRNFLTKDLRYLVSPAIGLARNGFIIGRSLSSALLNHRPSSEDPEWSAMFKDRRVGDTVYNPSLAKVMREVSRDPRTFYEGDLMKDVVKGLKEKGGILEEEDFSEFRGESVHPLVSSYRDYDLYEIPPNTQGITTLQMLNMIELSGINRKPFNDITRVNYHMKIAAVAYYDRDRFVADPRYYQPPDYLLDKDYLLGRMSEEGVMPLSKGSDTTFFVVADGENEVGFIQSLFEPFGSGVVVNGMVFHNRGYGFSKRGPNAPAPRKRPMTTLSILMAEREDDMVIIGCSAGHLRPQVHSQVLEYLVDYAMELDEAVYSPRFMLTEGRMIGERRLGIPGAEADSFTPAVGVVQALRRRGENYISVADPRSEGVSLSI